MWTNISELARSQSAFGCKPALGHLNPKRNVWCGLRRKRNLSLRSADQSQHQLHCITTGKSQSFWTTTHGLQLLGTINEHRLGTRRMMPIACLCFVASHCFPWFYIVFFWKFIISHCMAHVLPCLIERYTNNSISESIGCHCGLTVLAQWDKPSNSIRIIFNSGQSFSTTSCRYITMLGQTFSNNIQDSQIG